MAQRIELDRMLRELLGNNNVYFQPPETVKIKYPCIVYKLSGNDVRHANNELYSLIHEYTLLLIDRNPDSEFPDKLEALPMCHLSRPPYVADNLYHYPFDIYF